MRTWSGVASRLAVPVALGLFVGACSKKASPPPPDRNTPAAGSLVLRGDDGGELKVDDLDGVTGKVDWAIVGAATVPAEARALHDQGRAAGGKGEYPKSIELLRAASEKAPDWPYPVYDLAYTYQLQGDDVKAEETYLRVEKLAPRGFFTAKTSLDCLRRQRAGTLPTGFCKSFALLEFMEPAQQKEALQGIVEKLPIYAPAWKDLASLLDDDAAKLRAIEQGLAHDPDGETKGVLLVNQALLLDRRGQHDAAVKILVDLALDPNATQASEATAKFALRNLTRKR